MPNINIQQLKALETNMADQTKVSWRSVARSDVGLVRELNEDAYLNYAEQGLWAVSDGMGGHSRGDYASKVVVESLVHYARQSTLPGTIVDIESRLKGAHESCRSSFKDTKVGATACVLTTYGSYAFFLWAGDSRIYHYRNNTLKQVTTDHTLAQRKVACGELRPAQAALHPSAHVLTRAVGINQSLHLELEYCAVEAGDRFLICSDGLYNDLASTDIADYLSLPNIDKASDALFDRALARGGHDNITAVVLEADAMNTKQA